MQLLILMSLSPFYGWPKPTKSITKYNQTIQSECWLNVFIFVKRIKLTHVSRLKDKRILSSSQTRNIKNITYELATIGVGANIFLNARSGCDGAKSVVQTDDPEYPRAFDMESRSRDMANVNTGSEGRLCYFCLMEVFSCFSSCFAVFVLCFLNVHVNVCRWFVCCCSGCCIFLILVTHLTL